MSSAVHDVHQWEHLGFPRSLPSFQKLFPNDDACARYLEGAKWPKGFECPHCHEKGEPVRLVSRPGVLMCRKCRKQTSLTVDTVMERTHSSLTTWFWGAYLVSTSTPGISAVQFQRQLGLTRYETAFQILHKLRAGMVRPNRDPIGSNLARGDHVEVDECYIGGETRGKGKGPHADEKSLIIAAVEVRTKKTKDGKPMRRGGRYAGRLRIEIAPDRTEKALCGFVEAAVAIGAIVITDAAPAYNSLGTRGYAHLPVVEGGDHEVAEEYLPIIHLVFSNLKAWLKGTHHGRVEPKHLQTYLNEFAFRFNRRFYPFNGFRSLLGIGANGESPTYDGLYSGKWHHQKVSHDDDQPLGAAC